MPRFRTLTERIMTLIPVLAYRIAVGAFVAVFANAASSQVGPAAAPVSNVTDTYFGVAVPDPYRSLEDMKNPDVASWMKAQAAHTRAVLDRVPQRDKLLAEISRNGDAAAARVSSVQISADHV